MIPSALALHGRAEQPESPKHHVSCSNLHSCDVQANGYAQASADERFCGLAVCSTFRNAMACQEDFCCPTSTNVTPSWPCALFADLKLAAAC